jgi:peptide/nickel transport system substrate-binding protein
MISELNASKRDAMLREAQKMLATEAVNGFLCQPVFPTIAREEVKGLWPSMPIVVNDLMSLSWGS